MTTALLREDAVAAHVLETCLVLSASPHTRKAYLTDAKRWLAFCAEHQIEPAKATALQVAAWAEEMKRDGLAPTTCRRRLAALSSIYDRMRRDGRFRRNPFSVLEGPKRAPATVLSPTPIAEAKIVAEALRLCEAGRKYEDVRDAAILRLLWATGCRRSSLVQMTRERLEATEGGYIARVPGKRGKTLRLWIERQAARALGKLLTRSPEKTGHVFRLRSGEPMVEQDVWRIVRRRGAKAGGKLTPHRFRVAFLTMSPSSLDERQDAAGHSSANTTRMYDRAAWRGKRAFELMPEIEEAAAAEEERGQ